MEQKPLALIIEDNEDQRWIFSSAVEDAGYAVEAVEDGQAAIGRLAEVYVILATADAQVAEELRSQADLVLLKPISFFQLNQLAERFLKSPGRDSGKDLEQ